MIDIKAMQNSFIVDWATKLCNTEERDWKMLLLYFLRKIGGALVFNCNIDKNDFKGMHLIDNPFWKKVLITWLEYPWEDGTNEVYLSNPIFNNKNISFKGKVIFYEYLVRKNFLSIRNVYVGERLMSLDEFKEVYGFYNGIELDYNVITNALLKTKIRSLDNNKSRIKILEKCSRRELYENIRAAGKTEHVNNFWNRKGLHVDSNVWKLPFKTSTETRLQILQWKILHNIYPTRILLYKMKITDTMKCKDCAEIEYSEHFFFQCPSVKMVWGEIENIIASRIIIIIIIKFISRAPYSIVNSSRRITQNFRQ